MLHLILDFNTSCASPAQLSSRLYFIYSRGLNRGIRIDEHWEHLVAKQEQIKVVQHNHAASSIRFLAIKLFCFLGEQEQQELLTCSVSFLRLFLSSLMKMLRYNKYYGLIYNLTQNCKIVGSVCLFMISLLQMSLPWILFDNKIKLTIISKCYKKNVKSMCEVLVYLFIYNIYTLELMNLLINFWINAIQFPP